MHIYIHAFIHTYIQTYIHTYIHAYIHTYIVHTCTYIHTYIHTYINTYIHTCTCIIMNTYIHTYVRTYVCIHAYIVYIHTYIHTYISFCNDKYTVYDEIWLFRSCTNQYQYTDSHKTHSITKYSSISTPIYLSFIMLVLWLSHFISKLNFKNNGRGKLYLILKLK